MAKRTGPSNPNLQGLIHELKRLSIKEKVKIWRRIAEDLSRSTRQRREVNLDRINRVTKNNDFIIVPGKVLGQGELNHNVKIAAWRFSESAKQKIKDTMSIEELIKSNPKGKGLRIIG